MNNRIVENGLTLAAFLIAVIGVLVAVQGALVV